MSAVNLPFLDNPSSPPEKYSITGILSPDMVPGIRRNVVDFSNPNEPDASIRRQWNLYLMGLSRFQAIDEEDPLSYYQVAGIHGAPFIHWMEKPQPGDRPGNYCTHSSSLFLTWHRPYLLLFEQRVVEEALKYASQLDEEHKELYEEEARQIRIPYWDWATDHNLPEAVRNREVEIDLPRPKGEDGPAKRTIENPLYSYKFKSQLRITRDFGLLDSVWWPDLLETRRCPSWDPGYPSDMQVASDQLVNPKDPIYRLPTNYRDGMHHLLTKINEYGPFSNTGFWKDKIATAVDHFTLESYHNSVHNYTGTNYRLEKNPDDSHKVPPTGHMSEVPVSAFDPIFWLHHANIDRIYAMWQSINPNSEFQDQKVEPTRLPTVEGLDAQDKIGGSLRPFYQNVVTVDNSNEYKVWDSGMVQCGGGTKPRVFDFGYTYPEVLYSLKDDEERLKRHVLEQTNILYQPINIRTFHELKRHQLGPERPVDILALLNAKGVSISAETSARSFSELLAAHVEDDNVNKAKYRRAWTITLNVKRFLVKGNFTIFFFLGKPSDDPSTWIADPQQIGSFSTFKSQAEKCTNCAKQELEGAVMKAGLDITEDLFKAMDEEGADFADLNDTEKITDWLKKKFTWRMLEHDSRESVDLTRLLQREPEGLTVTVSSFIVPFPIGEIQPILGAPDGTPVQGHPGVVFPPVDFAKFGIFDEQVHEVVTRRKRDIGGYSF